MAGGRILVVDDDLSLLGFISKYLSRLGYRVTTCRGSEEAWRIFSEAGASFVVAVIDLTLPGLPSAQLSRMMLERNPETRLVFTSGFHMDPNALDGAGAGHVAFLQKPFTPAMLVETIAGLLPETGADRC